MPRKAAKTATPDPVPETEGDTAEEGEEEEDEEPGHPHDQQEEEDMGVDADGLCLTPPSLTTGGGADGADGADAGSPTRQTSKSQKSPVSLTQAPTQSQTPEQAEKKARTRLVESANDAGPVYLKISDYVVTRLERVPRSRLFIDRNMERGQARIIDEEHVLEVVRDLTENNPDGRLRLLVWDDQGV